MGLLLLGKVLTDVATQINAMAIISKQSLKFEVDRSESKVNEVQLRKTEKRL